MSDELKQLEARVKYLEEKIHLFRDMSSALLDYLDLKYVVNVLDKDPQPDLIEIRESYGREKARSD